MKSVVLYGDWIAAVLLATGCGILYFNRRSPKWTLVLLATVLNVPAVWWFAAARPVRVPLQAAHREAADLEFLSLRDGAPRRLSQYRGQVVVLNLWATWCGPCLKEMPALDRLQREQKGVVVIAVSDQTLDELRAFEPLRRMQLIAGRVDAARASPAIFVGSDVLRPITHIIDRQGVLRDTLLGEQTYESFLAAILRYL